MFRALLLLAPFLLLLPSGDANAQSRPWPPPPRFRPRHGQPPPDGFPPPPVTRPCTTGGCSLDDLVEDVQEVTETSEDAQHSDGSAAETTTETSTAGADASSLSDFPNNDSFSNVQAMLQFVSEEYGIPLQLVYATAWTESSWNQWTSDGTVLIGGYDYGLMQINKDTWDGTYDWDTIQSDVRENIQAGAEILQWSYNYAESKGYTGDDLAKAAYAVYNGGPDAVSRPWDESSAWRQNDLNFWSNYAGKPWESNS